LLSSIHFLAGVVWDIATAIAVIVACFVKKPMGRNAPTAKSLVVADDVKHLDHHLRQFGV
jgi:hypothetical protein